MASATLVKSDHELAGRALDAAALHLQVLGRDRLDRRPINHVTGTYNVFRKAACSTGRYQGYMTLFEVAKAIYPNVRTGADARSKRSAVQRDLRRLAAMGALHVEEHASDAGQTLGFHWQLVDRDPDPEAWPDLRHYSARRYPQRLAPVAQLDKAPGRRTCRLRPREHVHRADPRRRVHRWNRRVGRGSEHRYDVVPGSAPPPAASSAHETFEAPRSLPPSLRDYVPEMGAGDRGERETRVGRSAPPSRWATLTRCRTAARGRGGPSAVLAVPGADWCSMATAAFEANFLSSTGKALGDFDEFIRRHEWDPAVGPPPPGRYLTLSATWAERLETWCRMYDRQVKEAGAGIRSLLEDIYGWQPSDGAPMAKRRGGEDVGVPCTLAFFVARLGRRAKRERARRQPRRRENMTAWALGERWGDS